MWNIFRIFVLTKHNNMSKIIFNEQEHSYKRGDVKYTSVTKLINKYKPPFRKDHWSSYKALEKIHGDDFKEKRKGFNPADPAFIAYLMKYTDEAVFIEEKLNILEQWQQNNVKAVRRGNKYHKAREYNSIARGEEENPFTKEIYPVFTKEILKDADNYSILNNLYELEDGYYPELLLWNNEYEIAGQADRVFITTVDGKKVVDIDDYKTNNKITTENKFNKFKAPLNHLEDCKLNLYNLQISCYAWLMEQFGFEVRNLAFHHYNNKYDLNYLKPEVESILNLHKNA